MDERDVIYSMIGANLPVKKGRVLVRKDRVLAISVVKRWMFGRGKKCLLPSPTTLSISFFRHDLFYGEMCYESIHSGLRRDK